MSPQEIASRKEDVIRINQQITKLKKTNNNDNKCTQQEQMVDYINHNKPHIEKLALQHMHHVLSCVDHHVKGRSGGDTDTTVPHRRHLHDPSASRQHQYRTDRSKILRIIRDVDHSFDLYVGLKQMTFADIKRIASRYFELPSSDFFLVDGMGVALGYHDNVMQTMQRCREQTDFLAEWQNNNNTRHVH